MKRLIHLFISDTKNTPDGFNSIHIKDLNSISNCSVDHIYCDCLEFLSLTDAIDQLKNIMQKIRPQGFLSLSVTNIKQLCRNYYMNSLNDEDFIRYNHGHNCILSINAIIEHIQSTGYMKVINITDSTNNDLITNITSQRISV